jgi:hypothetical protein
MAELDVDKAVRAGTSDDQKKRGTFNDHFVQLKYQFKALMDVGADDPEVYQAALMTLLRGFEGIRVEQERQIRDYEKKIAYCRAKQESCSMFASMLIGVLVTKVNEAKHAKETGGVVYAPDGTPRERDVDVVGKRVCICGCQDEEDEADCTCVCHSEKYCSDDRCLFCQGRRAADEANQKPAKKKAAKKKVTKKTSKKATRAHVTELMRTSAKKSRT